MIQLYPFVKTKSSILRKLFVCFAVLLLTQQLQAQPTITSFAPASGSTGTSVTITGANFSITPINNVVYFGAGRATVTSADYTALTVTVPVGATYQPITVTTNGLTAYSARPFTVTYNSQAQINASSFSRNDVPLGSAGFNPTNITAADLDGDGKPEMITGFSSAVIIYRPGIEGTFEYSPALTFNTGTSTKPQSISAGDIDGDGKPDLVLVQNGVNLLSVYRNTSTIGSLSFAAPVNYTTGLGPTATGIRDLNGDGKPDVAITVSNTNAVNIYQNNSTPGNISLSANLYLTCDFGASELVINDFDGDGNPDIAIGNSSRPYMNVFRNTSASGKLSFTGKIDFALPGNIISLCSGDVDGDAKPDLVTANSNNSISVLRNTGTSGAITFDNKIDFPTGAGPTSVIMSNLNGDGVPDIAVANSDQNTVSIFKNNSTPGVISLATKVDFSTGSHPLKLCAADLNQDGKPDLAVSNNYLNTNTVYKNNGINEPAISSFTPTNAKTGTTVTINGANFTGATRVSFGGMPATSFTVVSPTQITAVVGKGTAGKVAVTTPEGVGTAIGFEYAPNITSFAPTTGVVGTTVTINGNGFSTIPDNNMVFFGAVRATVTAAATTALTVVVPPGATYKPISVTIGGVTAWTAQPFSVTFPGGGGNFTSSSFAAKTDFTTGYDPYSVAISDLDGDGLPDMAVGVRYTGYVSLYRNITNGTINFASKIDYTAASNTFCIATGDFNGDGKPDLVTANSLAMNLTTMKNNSTRGNLSFGAAQIVSGYYTGDQSYWVEVADVDGDGKPDIIAGNYSPNNVTVFRNTSTLTDISFDMKVEIPVASSAKNIAVGDLDGDGRLDLAVSTNGMVSILKNNCTPGNISFTNAGNYVGKYGAAVVQIADLNGDSKPDLAVTSSDMYGSQTNTVSIFQNTGSAGTISFAPKADFPVSTGSTTTGFTIGDLNGDGKPDLAVIDNFQGYKIAVIRNTSVNGVISFSGDIDYIAGTNATGIAIADLNGDGKPDIVETNANGNLSSVSVLKNTYKTDPPKITSFTPQTAQSGEQITITGKNFIPGTTVVFGKVLAMSVNVTSDSTLTVIVGAGATGYVRLNTEGGADSLSGFTFVPAIPTITTFTPTSAARTTAVIIKGTHFAGATAVYFGNTPAFSFTVTTDTTINAIVAQGASGYVRIITPFGADSLSGFTYTPYVPVITSFSPMAARQGDGIIIKGTGFTGATSVSFGGQPASSISVINDTTLSAIVGPGFTGDVIVTGPDGKDTLGGFVYTGTTITSFTPAVSGKGKVVTIKGTNLRNAYAVSFGGISAAAFTVLSDTSLTATVATGATGAVNVTTLQGSGSRNGFIFLLPPVINSFTPPVGDTGDTIKVNGKYLTYADSVLFGGTPATWFKIINDTSLVAIVTNGSSGDVSVITAGGTGTKAGFIYKTAPIITSFTPGNAPAGSTVSISGIRFGQTPADNIVYFGAVKATVLTATSTNLTVQVPYGATYAPISVTTTGGTGYAAREFIVTFKGGDTAFTQNSFAAKIDLAVVPGVTDGAITDVFEDGKPDLITGSGNPATISMFKNTSLAGAISFDPKKDFAANLDVVQIALSDLNGDGKPDLSLSSSADGRPVAVYLNTTTNGNVTLNPGIILTNPSPDRHTIASADVDNDGKPDVGALSFYGGSIPVYRNISTGNSLSFDPQYLAGSTIDKGLAICFSDIDMDGKLDMVAFYALSFSVYRNIGTKGLISFAGGVNYRTGAGSTLAGGIVAGDIDGDGKPDVAMASGTLSVFRNTSKPGSISFDAVKNYTTGPWSIDVSMGDLNGDGKPDLVTSNRDAKTVSVYKNSSTPGTISIEPKVDYAIGDTPKNTGIADLDADGKPELVVFSSNMVSIFKNQMNNIPAPVINSFTPDSGYTGTTVTIKGHDLTGTTSVKFGGMAATSFTVVSDSIITAVVGTGATGDVSVTTAVGSDTLAGFNFVIPLPAITSFTPTSGTINTVVTIRGSNFTGANSVTFGGTAATSFTIVSDSIIIATVGAGATGAVEVITQYGTDMLGGFTFIAPVVTPDITSFTPAIGTTGTLVTIKGNRFTGTTAVNFGGTPAASFTVVSDSIITATVSTGATGIVQVTTPHGSDTLGRFAYTVIVQPPPVITSYTPASGSTGTTITIKGSHFTDVTDISFGGAPATSFTVISDSVITAIVGTGGTGAVQATSTQGTATLSGFTYVIPVDNPEITVAPNPASGFVIVKHPVVPNSAQIKLVDMMGNVVQSVTVNPGTDNTRLTLTGIKQGIYTVSWSDGHNSFSKLLLIQ